MSSLQCGDVYTFLHSTLSFAGISDKSKFKHQFFIQFYFHKQQLDIAADKVKH